ncbi:hypothetical protein KSS87_017897, partial [Heliosperma pusillum]
DIEHFIADPGSTFFQSARSGMIGALLGTAFFIPFGISVQEMGKRYREALRLEQSEEGDIEHGTGAIEKHLEVQG